MSDPKQYKIVELRAEGFKRLTAVTIRPRGNLVQITGANGEGKSSTLDAIWAAIGGKDACPAVPIRRGEERARLRLDLGELIVTRTFSLEEGGDYTTSVTVESPEGARFPSPQKVLDALLGELSFDPLAFARMKPREQFETLRRFVPGVDFDAIDQANKKDFDRRTELNRFAKQERAAAAAITVPEGTPEEPVDEASLTDELARAGETNADLERRRANRERVAEQIREIRETLSHTEQSIEAAATNARALAARELKRIEEQIAALERQKEAVQREAEATIAKESERIRTAAAQARAQAEELQGKLDACEALPASVDVEALRLRIEEARGINAAVNLREQQRRHVKRAEQLEQESGALTAAMEKRTLEKEGAIAAASMPVEGIGFGAGCVTLKGVPFEQASSAEQLRASVAIAMARNPRLKVVLIRDGSLLDERSLALIAQMADANACQVWLERVDTSGRIGFVIENGEVKASAQPAEAPAGEVA